MSVVLDRLQQQKTEMAANLQRVQETLVGTGTLFKYQNIVHKVVQPVEGGYWECVKESAQQGSTQRVKLHVKDIVGGID